MYGNLSLEDKVRILWNQKNCAKVCEIEDLPEEGVEGQLLRSGGVLYYFEDGVWKPLNSLSFPLTFDSNEPLQEIVMFAERSFTIDTIESGTPGTVEVTVNGNAYILGTLINKYDRIKFSTQGNGMAIVTGTYVNVDFYDIRVSIPVYKSSWAETETDNIIIGITNVGPIASTSPITIRLTKADPNFTFTPNVVDTSVIANGVTYAVNNDQFTTTTQATRHNFVTASGVYLQPGESLWISVPTEATGLSGGTASITASLAPNVNDLNANNNTFVTDTLTIT